MKVKTKLFLLSAIALAFVACAMFGTVMMNNTTPTTASAEGENYYYFINADNWASVYAYTFGGDGASFGGWPGTEMERVGTTNFYKIAESGAPASIIFNNGSGIQTSNLTAEVGKYYYGKDGGWASNSTLISALTDDGTPVTVYFYNGSNWSEVYGYSWLENGDHDVAYNYWKQVELDPVSEGSKWYRYTFTKYDSYGTGIIFHNGESEGSEKKTGDLTLTTGYPYFSVDKWFDHAVEHDQYYVQSNKNSYSPAASDVMTKLSPSDGQDRAVIYNIDFSAGDQYEIIYVGETVNVYYGKTGEGGGNHGEIETTGKYAVILTSGYAAKAVQQVADLAISSGKYKRGTSYVVIAAAFQIEALVSNVGSYTIGYNDGSDHDDNVYYSGLYLKTGAETYSDRITADSLFGVTGGKLIVFEITKPITTTTYQLYIKYNGVKVATRNVTVTLA